MKGFIPCNFYVTILEVRVEIWLEEIKRYHATIHATIHAVREMDLTSGHSLSISSLLTLLLYLMQIRDLLLL